MRGRSGVRLQASGSALRLRVAGKARETHKSQPGQATLRRAKSSCPRWHAKETCGPVGSGLSQAFRKGEVQQEVGPALLQPRWRLGRSARGEAERTIDGSGEGRPLVSEGGLPVERSLALMDPRRDDSDRLHIARSRHLRRVDDLRL